MNDENELLHEDDLSAGEGLLPILLSQCLVIGLFAFTVFVCVTT